MVSGIGFGAVSTRWHQGNLTTREDALQPDYRAHEGASSRFRL
jgi:hypothetical protein